MLSRKIEKQIRDQIRTKDKQRTTDDSYRLQDSLSVADILEIKELTEATIPRVLECVEAKKLFWERMRGGFPTLAQYRDVAMKLVKLIERLINDFDY